MQQLLSTDILEKRKSFFRFLFEGHEGFVAVARIDRPTKDFDESFFKFPEQFDDMMENILSWAVGYDVYFCPMLLSKPKRTKENVGYCPVVWADLDKCPPEATRLKPTIVVETSKGSYQAYWSLSEQVHPADVESIARRLAYAHEAEGADTSGWDLTQLMRVPFTMNHKYNPMPFIKVKETSPGRYSKDAFTEVYPPSEFEAKLEFDFPEAEGLPLYESKTEPPRPATGEEVLASYRTKTHPSVLRLFHDQPEAGKWSEALFQLTIQLFELGLSREEAFVVARDAACNKFRRDGKSDIFLWKDICRTWGKFVQQHTPVTADIGLPDLLTPQERELAAADKTIVEEYIEWAKGLGDAAWQYHQAGAFIILSSLVAGPVRLPTSYGVLLPNMWFMILADTTLTRKTTAMDIAMDMVTEIDSDAVLATDGSIEGLFTSLSTRPGRPSIFLRDEFSGLLEMITKKDYYAGMAETLTKLYDGKYQKRVLRKETIEVKEPVLVLFAGGIRERVLSLLTYEHVASGFLPRFVFITAESDVAKLQPLGPPSERSIGQRDYIISRFRAIHAHYTRPQYIEVKGKRIEQPSRWDAELTPAAWAKYNEMETKLLSAGVAGFHADILTPTFDRMCKSGLKAAVLIAAARELKDRVVVEERDVIKAFWYIEQWRGFVDQIINGIGRTGNERLVGTIHAAICRKPGLFRSELMRNYHLDARATEHILSTLEQRDLITRAKVGKGERLHPVVVNTQGPGRKFGDNKFPLQEAAS